MKPPSALPDDPRAEGLLEQLLQRMSSDPYVLLSLPKDATFEQVRQQVRNVQRSVETIAARPLSARQARDLGEMRARIEKAAGLLSTPHPRIAYDAWHANFPGVARCIASGLNATELETLHARYLLAHPGTEVRERIHATSAASREGRGELAQALAEYEKALTFDPLNVQLHQRYWSLKRRDPRADAVTPSAPVQGRRPSGGFPAVGESIRPSA